jgi:thiol-disulfide isomerase/thioredoxin
MRQEFRLLMLALFVVSWVNAQSVKVNSQLVPGTSNLTVGDQFPDFVIKTIIHSSKRTARTSDFKNQLLIIDFWSTWCPGCIEALPKMDSLQKQFGTKIKILPVTDQAESIVTGFWKANENTRNLRLPSVVEDRLFASYFRHQTIPHEVWIDKGIVIGITTAEYVDVSNIQKVLSGKSVNWPVKNDFYVFDKTKPLFVPDSNQININRTFLKYAAIDSYKDGINSEGFTGGSGIVRDSKTKTIRVYFLNQPIFNSYLYYWSNVLNMHSLIKPSFSYYPNQFVFETADRLRYQYISKKVSGYEQDWVRKYGICFESVNPDTGQTDKAVYKTVIADLDRLLGLKVRWEKRSEKVLVLVRTAQQDRVKSKSTIPFDETGHPVALHYIQKGTLHQFREGNLSTLVSIMNQEETNPYVFDETSYQGKVDMDLIFPSWTDIAAIRKALQPYGLDLKEEERIVDKFVFTGEQH